MAHGKCWLNTKEFIMALWQWLSAHWGWFIVTLVLGGYFAFYVLAARDQRSHPGIKRLPPKDC